MAEEAGVEAGASPEATPGSENRPWFIASRIQALEGEVAANRLRLATVAVFYVVELLNCYGLDLGFLRYPPVPGVAGEFHAAITAACLAWVVMGWTVGTCLRRRYFPPSLSYAAACADATVLTAVLLIADGARSPLVVAYLLLPPLAALRLDERLVRFATGASLAGYAVLLANARWYRPAFRTPRHHQLIFVVALVVCGVFLTRALRRVEAMAREYTRLREREEQA